MSPSFSRASFSSEIRYFQTHSSAPSACPLPEAACWSGSLLVCSAGWPDLQPDFSHLSCSRSAPSDFISSLGASHLQASKHLWTRDLLRGKLLSSAQRENVAVDEQSSP